MRGPTLDEFTAKVESYKPTFVYISGPYSGLVDSIKGAIGPITLQGGSPLHQPLSFSELQTMPAAYRPLRVLWQHLPTVAGQLQQ